MEGKLIIYIIGGIVYFFYTLAKNKQEQDRKKKQAQASVPAPEQPAVPVKPTTGKPLDDLLREVKQRQAAAERKKREELAQAEAAKKQAQKPKDIFVHEKRPAVFGEGANLAPQYERTRDAQRIVDDESSRRSLEAIYKPPAEIGVEEAEQEGFQFNAREAFIGSVIFERKY